MRAAYLAMRAAPFTKTLNGRAHNIDYSRKTYGPFNKWNPSSESLGKVQMVHFDPIALHNPASCSDFRLTCSFHQFQAIFYVLLASTIKYI